MQPILKKLEEFKITGIQTRTKNSDEFHEATAKIPQLWQQFHAQGLGNKGKVYGVYADYESDDTGHYTVTAGVATEENHGKCVIIPAGNYLAFKGKGPMPLAVIDTWKQIWSFFSTPNEYKRAYKSDFEAYESADEVTIYIGIIPIHK